MRRLPRAAKGHRERSAASLYGRAKIAIGGTAGAGGLKYEFAVRHWMSVPAVMETLSGPRVFRCRASVLGAEFA